ncbi:MAG: hydantoinase B/oxoprolinase family protein, partial [Rhizobiaceae bacterium]|nr:hydantoinase B/oxoprolinase family protein [Rhizobiaceae bacterium]
VVASDCNTFPSRGVRGGEQGAPAASFFIAADGSEKPLPNAFNLDIKAGEWLRGHESGGGGYGDPFERDPTRVLHDVLEGWETLERAHDVYGVVLTGSARDETLAVDPAATKQKRAGQRAPSAMRGAAH